MTRGQMGTFLSVWGVFDGVLLLFFALLLSLSDVFLSPLSPLQICCFAPLLPSPGFLVQFVVLAMLRCPSHSAHSDVGEDGGA